MAKVIVKNINTGGIADSAYLGVVNSVHQLVGFDIHSKPGVLKVNRAMVKKSGSVITERCDAVVVSSSGNTFYFSASSGKIWQRDFGGTFTLAATNANGAMSDAYEFQGYVYYSANNGKLGRILVGDPWSSRVDSWATFTNSTVTGGMAEVNQVLYIGNVNLVAKVESGTFTANALDVDSGIVIAALQKLGTDLIIAGNDVSLNRRASIIQWDTFSPSYSIIKLTSEYSINSLMPLENIILIQAGRKGALYTYDGVNVTVYKKLLSYLGTVPINTVVNKNAWCIVNGMTYFFLSAANITSSMSPVGIYSLGRSGKNYPIVLNCENLVSTGAFDSKVAGYCMAYNAPQDFYSVMYDDFTGTEIFAVDEQHATQLNASAYFITKNISVDREMLDNYGVAYVAYENLPANTDIDIDVSRNHGAFDASAEIINDTDRMVKYTKQAIAAAAIIQIKVTASVASGTVSPEIEQLIIDVT